VTINYSPALNTLLPGTNNVTATATDAQNNHAICHFAAVLPFLNLGPNGFASPIGGIGGSCMTPVKSFTGNQAGKIEIKFNTYFCNNIYVSTTPPTVTITKLSGPSSVNPPPCTSTGVVISGQQLSLTSNTWHWQWQTQSTDNGYFLISVDLGDGNPNPNSAIILVSH